MPLETLRPDVLREIEQERETRRHKAAEDAIDSRVKALDARLRRLEAVPRPAPPLGESFYRELVGMIRSFVDVRFGRLQNANEAIINRLKYLEGQPSLEYKGVHEPGLVYQKNAVVTFDGSLWIAKSNTGSTPGNAGGSHWKLCVKRGRDGKDANARS